jgi:hypothetical protein
MRRSRRTIRRGAMRRPWRKMGSLHTIISRQKTAIRRIRTAINRINMKTRTNSQASNKKAITNRISSNPIKGTNPDRS